jgi:hypothetical protein
MRQAAEIEGKQFGRLLVVGRAGMDKSREHARWLCRCDCGETAVVPTYRLLRDETQSCGCVGRAVASVTARRTHTGQRRALKHGMYIAPSGAYRTPTYRSWAAMIGRCEDKTNEHYGGRGITVCARWRGGHGYENFLADMGARPAGLTLDRYPNNDGNYEPGNCRWATPVQQNANRRPQQHAA